MDVTVGIPTHNRSRWLREAIESVLTQSYDDFALIVSDNASSDDTSAVVASFSDPRVEYSRLEHNIGMIGNMNRLIQLARTEFLVLLCDDDALHPDHLSMTIEALRRWPTAGAAHTGCRIVDSSGNTVDPHVRLMKTTESVVFQPRDEFLARSMVAIPACFSSVMFRRTAIIDGGGLRQDEELIGDLSLMMRIARNWDFVYLNRPLSVGRAHGGAESAALGWFTPSGVRWDRAFPDVLYERRRRFLAEADLADAEASRLRGLAERAHRHDRVRYLSMRATTGDGFRASFKALWHELRGDYLLASDPITWRFVAGQLGGRRLRRGVQWLRRSVRANQPRVTSEL